MRKSFYFLLLALSLASLAQAATPQATEYNDLGMALYRQGLYAKSILYFQNAVNADPSDWQGYENLGNAYFKINANGEALAAYQKSLQINPDNTTLENIVQSLQVNATPETSNSGTNESTVAPNPPPAASGSVENEQPIQNNPPAAQAPPSTQPPNEVVVTTRRGWRVSRQVAQSYQDGLAPINHSRFWIDTDLAYNWSNQADLYNGSVNFNNYIQQKGYTGIATMDHSGVEGGAEFGFMLDPYNGIALGVRGIVTTPYTSNVNYQNGGDFETINIQPYVVPLTLDYYLFLPDNNGRFFITAGVGYYFADVIVDDNFSSTNSGGSADEYLGDLTGSSVGFQFGLGREFEIGNHLGLRIFARGRYAKITNLNGSFYSANGVYDNYGLVTAPWLNGGIAVDSTSNIGGSEHYATLDYTGLDFGVGLTFF